MSNKVKKMSEIRLNQHQLISRTSHALRIGFYKFNKPLC